MLDLETLGTKPGSVILAIGATLFSVEKGIIDSFYVRVDPKSCVSLGLKMDVDTVMWWLNQDDAARKEISKPGGDHIARALGKFSEWLRKHPEYDPESGLEIWGNGASFDNVLLADAYDLAELIRPWKFWNDRCYRTVKAMRPDVPMPRTGTHHNALDDAKSQALHLIQILTSGI